MNLLDNISMPYRDCKRNVKWPSMHYNIWYEFDEKCGLKASISVNSFIASYKQEMRKSLLLKNSKRNYPINDWNQNLI